jgi:hypothetical protein
MAFAAITMVFVVSPVVFVAFTIVFVVSTMVFAAFTMVFVVSPVVFAAFTMVFVVSTMVFAAFAMVFAISTMLFVAFTTVFVVKTIVPILDPLCGFDPRKHPAPSEKIFYLLSQLQNLSFNRINGYCLYLTRTKTTTIFAGHAGGGNSRSFFV